MNKCLISAAAAVMVLMALQGCGKHYSSAVSSGEQPETASSMLPSQNQEPAVEVPAVLPPAKPIPPAKPSPRIILPEEIRAVWLTTVKGLDWPDAAEGPVLQRLHLRDLIRSIKDAGFNTVFFQVISNADALYPSATLPWSRVLCGTEGVYPGFDPLDEAVKACRKEGLEIHAWLNPLRIGPSSDKRSYGHPATLHKDWVMEYKGNLYWNPGVPAMRGWLSSVAEELVRKYDIDGVHIDDYFYPYGFREDTDNASVDEAAYKAYGNGLPRDEWRTANIDALVRELSDAVHSARPSALFGVSPAGRIVNTVRLYADPGHWAEEGTVDYLAPQIYWDINRTDDAAFPKALSDFAAATAEVPLIPGIAAYKFYSQAEKDAGFFTSMKVFSDEVSIVRGNPRCVGTAWFRAEHVLQPSFKDWIMKGIFAPKVLTPSLGRLGLTLEPVHLEQLPDKSLSWTASEGATDYVLMALSLEDYGLWKGEIIYEGPDLRFSPGPGPCRYVVVARCGAARSGVSNIVGR